MKNSVKLPLIAIVADEGMMIDQNTQYTYKIAHTPRTITLFNYFKKSVLNEMRLSLYSNL